VFGLTHGYIGHHFGGHTTPWERLGVEILPPTAHEHHVTSRCRRLSGVEPDGSLRVFSSPWLQIPQDPRFDQIQGPQIWKAKRVEPIAAAIGHPC
jgi:hypothetical protein